MNVKVKGLEKPVGKMIPDERVDKEMGMELGRPTKWPKGALLKRRILVDWWKEIVF